MEDCWRHRKKVHGTRCSAWADGNAEERLEQLSGPAFKPGQAAASAAVFGAARLAQRGAQGFSSATQCRTRNAGKQFTDAFRKFKMKAKAQAARLRLILDSEATPRGQQEYG